MPDGGGEGQENLGFLQVRVWGMRLQNLRWEMEATGEREEMFHLSFSPFGYTMNFLSTIHMSLCKVSPNTSGKS